MTIETPAEVTEAVGDFQARVARFVARFLAEQAPYVDGIPVAFIYARASKDPRDRGWSWERQVEENFRDAERQGFHVAAVFVDNDRSASIYATKEREEYDRMVSRMRRGGCDVLMYWESSRNTRDLEVYVPMRKLSRELGIKWFYNGHLYDFDNYDDGFRASLDIVLAEREVEVLRARTKAGIKKAANDGRPHGGPPPYGYFREYHSRTREFVAQHIDTTPRKVVTAAGDVVRYTPSDIVREIFRRVGGGESLYAVRCSLNMRGIPSPEAQARIDRGEAPGDTAWTDRRVRLICANAAYAGWRVHRGQLVRKGLWDAIVTDAQLQAVAVRLEDPKRKKAHTNKARNLLSYIARCGECGGPLSAGRRKARKSAHTEYMIYACYAKRCVAIRCEKLDAYVEAVIIERLSDPETLGWLVRADDDEASRAAEEARTLRATLGKWQAKAAAGEVSDPDEYEVITAGIRAKVAELEATAKPAYVPVVLHDLIGPQAAAVWDALSLPQKRDVIRCVADIELWKIGCGVRRFDPSRVRISWPLADKSKVHALSPRRGHRVSIPAQREPVEDSSSA